MSARSFTISFQVEKRYMGISQQSALFSGRTIRKLIQLLTGLSPMECQLTVQLVHQRCYRGLRSLS